MKNKILKQDPPEWMRYVAHSNRIQIDPIFLENSCFYYGAGIDLTPIIALQESCYFYIYCDTAYFTDLEKIKNELTLRLEKQGFNKVKNLDWSFTNFGNSANFDIKKHTEYTGFSNGTMSLYKKNDKYYLLWYLVNDSHKIWGKIYHDQRKTPFAICNYRYEGSSHLAEGEDNTNILPKYFIGYPGNENYKEIGTLKYYGDWADDGVKLFERP